MTETADENRRLKMKNCIICGKLIEDDVYHCPYCGEFNSCSGITYKQRMCKDGMCNIKQGNEVSRGM